MWKICLVGIAERENKYYRRENLENVNLKKDCFLLRDLSSSLFSFFTLSIKMNPL